MTKPDQVELELMQLVIKLGKENWLDMNKNFKSIDSLRFLNELDFDEIEAIVESIED